MKSAERVAATLVGLVVIAALVVVGLVVMRSPGTALPGEAHSGPPREAPDDFPPAPPGEAIPEAGPSTAGAGAGSLPPVSPEERTGPVLQVLAADGRPAAGAEITFVDGADIGVTDLESSRAFWMTRRFDDDVFARYGRSAGVTDDRGRLQLPEMERCRVRGVLGGGKEIGEDSVYRRSRHPMLRLFPADESLVVEVLDASGRPAAGVPVGLFEWHPGFHHGPTISLMVSELTAADGRAVFPRIHALLGEALPEGRGREGSHVFAALAIPVHYGETAAIDPDELPDAPVVLRLPETGSVTVHIAGADGKPYEQAATVGFNERNFSGGDPSSSAPVRTTSGRVDFPFVPAGATLAGYVRPEDTTLAPARFTEEGPSYAGQQVDIFVSAATANATVKARLVDESGEPLGDGIAELAEVKAPNPRTGLVSRAGTRFRSTADANGDVTWRMQRGRGLRSGGDFEVGHRPSSWPADGAIRHSARVSLGAISVGDAVELGEVVLRPTPLLVDGIVTDSEGAPIEEAQVSITDRKELGFFTTGADGRFAFWSHDRAIGEVRASTFGHDSDAVAFEPGQQGVRLELVEAATIVGSIRTATGAVSLAVGVRAAGSKRKSLLRKGTSNFALDVEPGTVELEAVFEGEAIATFGPYELAPGETLDVGELEVDLDLRSFVLRVTDPDGNPIEGAAVGRVGSERPFLFGMQRGDLGTTDPFGKVRIAAASEAIGIQLRARGYRRLETTVPTVDSTVVMSSGARVRFVLPADAVLPSSPYTVELSLRPVVRGSRQYSFVSQSERDGRPEYEYVFGEGGDYTVGWAVFEPDSTWGLDSMRQIHTCQTLDVTIEETGGLQTIVVPFPASDLEAVESRQR